MNTEVRSPASDEIDLFDLAAKIWAGRLVVLGTALLFALAGGLNAFLSSPVYESRAVLVPVSTGSSSGRGASALLSQFGPIAGIAGLSQPPQVPAATLKSVQFAEDFIAKFDLMPALFADSWDAGKGRWISEDPELIPDIRDAVGFFTESVLTVAENEGFVTVTIAWGDPAVAQDWAAKVVSFANETLRDRAIHTAERNMEYLKAEIPLTNSVTVQQSIGRLLDQEMQTLMLAKGNPEYAFTVIDPPKVPKYRSSPKRAQMVVLSMLAGFFMGLLVLLFRSAIQARKARSAATA